jgi:hypothetical protein
VVRAVRDFRDLLGACRHETGAAGQTVLIRVFRRSEQGAGPQQQRAATARPRLMRPIAQAPNYKHQTNDKHQTNNKHQIASYKAPESRSNDRALRLETWSLMLET